MTPEMKATLIVLLAQSIADDLSKPIPAYTVRLFGINYPKMTVPYYETIIESHIEFNVQAMAVWEFGEKYGQGFHSVDRVEITPI